MFVKIVNVIASTKMKQRIDIEKISRKLHNVQYDPDTFSGVVYRRENPKATVILFSTGKITSVGAKSITEARLAIRKTIEEIKGEAIGHCPISIENVVAFASLKRQLNLDKVLKILPSVYEPEMFPALIHGIKSEDSNVNILIFKSGKLILAGAKTKRQAIRIMEKISKKILNAK